MSADRAAQGRLVDDRPQDHFGVDVGAQHHRAGHGVGSECSPVAPDPGDVSLRAVRSEDTQEERRREQHPA